MAQIRHSKLFTDVARKLFKRDVTQRSLSTSFSCSVYDDHFSRSVETPEHFWDERARNINWFKKYEQILDHSNPPFTKWYALIYF